MRRGSASCAAEHGGSSEPQTVELPLSLGHVGATLGNDEELQAVVVQHVHPQDLAARAGVRPGDVIVAINDEPVSSHEDAIAKIEQAGNGILQLRYLPACAAEQAREQERRRAAERRPTQRWFTVSNVLIVVLVCVVLVQLSLSVSRAADPYGLSAEQLGVLAQMERMSELAIAHRTLLIELRRVADRAQHFLNRTDAGVALARHEPAMLVRMLRLTMALDELLNATDRLGLEGDAVDVEGTAHSRA